MAKGIGYAVKVVGKGAREMVEEFETKARAIKYAKLCAADGFYGIEVYQGSAQSVDSPFNSPILRIK